MPDTSCVKRLYTMSPVSSPSLFLFLFCPSPPLNPTTTTTRHCRHHHHHQQRGVFRYNPYNPRQNSCRSLSALTTLRRSQKNPTLSKR